MFNFSQIPITISLIAANVILSLIAFSNAEFMDKGVMWPYRVARERQYFRFVTSGFLHADLMHLIFNMFTLFYFGGDIERAFTEKHLGGDVAYLSLYFLALIISDIPTYLKYKNVYGYRSLGASGAVSAIVFAVVVLNPWKSIYLYGAFALSATVFAVLYVIYSITMSKRRVDNINHDAHLWGCVFGLVFTVALIYFMQPQLFDQLLENLKHPSLFGD